MISRIAEQQLAALGALEVQMRWVFPGETDAAVDLDVLSGRVEVSLAAVRLGQRRHRRQLIVHLRSTPHRVVSRALGRFDFQQHVGTLVLDRLEPPCGLQTW